MKALGADPRQSQAPLLLLPCPLPPFSLSLLSTLTLLPPPPFVKMLSDFWGGGGEAGWAGLGRGASQIVDIPGPAALRAPIL